MQLNELCADTGCGCNLLQIWRNEQTDLDPGIIHFFSCPGQCLEVADYIQPSFRRYFLTPFRNQADDVRLQFQCDGDDFPHIGHLQI